MSKNKRGGGADGIYTAFGLNPYKTNPSIQREHQIGRMIAKAISELAMNRFKWENLPDTIDPRFLEYMLFYHGVVIWYEDTRWNKEFVVRGTGAGYVNVFDNPVSFNVIAPGQNFEINGTQSNTLANKILKAYDPTRHSDLSPEEKREYAVPIWSNYTRYPDWDIVQIYSTRLATMDRTIEINSSNARRSRVLRATPNTQLSVANAARAVDQGENVVTVTGPMEDLSFIDTIDLSVPPESYEKLSIMRTRSWNECMTLLGIDSANQDKKERLVADEVAANDAQTDSMRYVALNARRQAAGYINDIFGHNITVDFNTEVEAQAEAVRQASLANSSNNEDSNMADDKNDDSNMADDKNDDSNMADDKNDDSNKDNE